MALMTFTGAETDCSTLAVNFKAASGPKATLMTITPAVLASVGTGTLSAGSAGGGTLGTLLAYDVTGCFIKTTGGTGGGGTGGANNQARKIVTYNTGTGAFTVVPNWETTPSTDTTYDVLLPEGVTLGMLRALNPTTAGRTLDVSAGGEAGIDWANVGSPTTSLALTGTTVATTQKVDVETIKTNPVANAGTVTFPTNATLASTTNITAAAGCAVSSLGADVITAAAAAADFVTEIASAVHGNALPDPVPFGSLTMAIYDTQTAVSNVPAGVLAAAGSAPIAADVQEIGGSAPAATNQRDAALAVYRGVVDSGTATTVVDDGLTQADANHWVGRIIVFLTGDLALQLARITAFNPGTDTLTVEELTRAPTAGDTFVIL